MNFNLRAAIVEKPTPTDAHAELVAENARLHVLVADLLVKNQQLRAALQAAQRPSMDAFNY